MWLSTLQIPTLTWCINGECTCIYRNACTERGNTVVQKISKNATRSLKCPTVLQRTRTFLLDHNKLYFQRKTSWQIEALLEHQIWMAMSDWPPPELEDLRSHQVMRKARRLFAKSKRSSKPAKLCTSSQSCVRPFEITRSASEASSS